MNKNLFLILLLSHISLIQTFGQDTVVIFDINNYKVSAISKPVDDPELFSKKVRKLNNNYYWKNEENRFFECSDSPIIVKVETLANTVSYCLACMKNSVIDYTSNCILERDFLKIE